MKLVLNDNNVDAALEGTWATPMFLLLFSQMCPHCTRIKPIWESIENKYDQDPNITVAEVNCWEYHSICQRFHIRAYPSFYSVSGDDWCPIVPERSFDGFDKEAQRIRQFGKKDKPLYYPSSFQGFPAFVFHFPISLRLSDSNYQKIVSALPSMRNQIFVSEAKSVEPTQLEAIIGNGTTVKYQGNSTNEGIVEFIEEYSFEPMGNWTIENASKVQRPIIFFVYGEESQVKPFAATSLEVSPKVLVGKMKKDIFSKRLPGIRLKMRELPVAVQLSKDMSSYRLLKSSEIESGLASFISAAVDGSASFSPIVLSKLSILQDMIIEMNIFNIAYIVIVIMSVFLVFQMWKGIRLSKTE